MTSSAKPYARAKYACFLCSISMALACNVGPLYFLTFREQYGISFSLLGFLVVLNFGTQLLLDTVFSFFSHKFPLKTVLCVTPWIMSAGLILYALAPILFPASPYLGLALGTLVYSAGMGLSEVLVSPTVAQIPCENPERQMSTLHACYAWGVVFLVALSTGFILLFGAENWQYFVLFLALFPASAGVLFLGAEIPPMPTQEKTSAAAGLLKDPTVLFFLACIFLGGAAENGMSQWCSGYLETAFGIPKAVGDLGGVALFGAALGLGRTLYAKFGKNIRRTLFFGFIGATACYAVAVFSPTPVLGLSACVMTGFCTSMLWPGTLIAVAEDLPSGGVALYALMAMGGDMGAALCPQIVGWVTDGVLSLPGANTAAEMLGITADQFSMKCGMAAAMLFPLAAVLMFRIAGIRKKNRKTA